MKIRPETPDDIGLIATITSAAFKGFADGSHTEAAIIDTLRSAGALTLSLVIHSCGTAIFRYCGLRNPANASLGHHCDRGTFQQAISAGGLVGDVDSRPVFKLCDNATNLIVP